MPIPRSDGRPPGLRTLVVATACAVLVFSLGLELALRPALLPDEVPEREMRCYAASRRIEEMVGTGGCGGGEGERTYDVNRALLSDEPLELEPEGLGPARRRHVPSGPEAVMRGGVIEGTTTLVRGTAFSGSSRRRRPAL